MNDKGKTCRSVYASCDSRGKAVSRQVHFIDPAMAQS